MGSVGIEPLLLVVDDDEGFRQSMAGLLEKQGFVVRQASDGATALDVVGLSPIAVALVDVQLPDMSGVDLIPQILERSPGTLCIAVTAAGTAEVGAVLLDVGAKDYFEKPIRDWVRFDQAIRNQMSTWQAVQELAALQERVQQMRRLRESDSFRELKGNSPAMQALIEEIRLLGPLPVAVLIRGESGTGKELVARALHRQRSPGAFVPVNCAAIPRELFESELFGHVVGSFTDARERAGLCAAAAGGTLFLDEVGEIPLELQAKLLRVLEQREYRRVGSDRAFPLEARIIAATNVDLEAAITAGRFREDLYFRLSAQEIWVPPLRARHEDIQQLTYHFVSRYNQLFERNIQGLSPAALQRLEQHDWTRNNVRELDREIQRAVARCPTRTLTPDLFFRPTPTPTPTAVPSTSTQVQVQTQAQGDGCDGLCLPPSLLSLPYGEACREAQDHFRRWFLTHHLQAADWNQTAAARAARMQRTLLTRLMNELGIERPPSDP